MKRICMWSGPRNISTAMMYFFHHRGDCEVIDEPFYGYYLLDTGLLHPGREDIIAENETWPAHIISRLVSDQGSQPIRFIKNMPHHMNGINLAHLFGLDHFFLIREPRAMIASYLKRMPSVEMSDVGIDRQFELYQLLREQGKQPAIVDSADVLAAPANVLGQLCAHLSIPFDERMLAWPSGAISGDGTWAKYWYDAVHASTGFAAPSTSTSSIELPAAAEALALECEELYNQMRTERIRP